MMLDPLTEIGIGVLVTVVIGRGQLVMDILRNGKRGQTEQDHDHRQRDHPAKQRNRCGRPKHQTRLFLKYQITENNENLRQTSERLRLLSSRMDFSCYFRISCFIPTRSRTVNLSGKGRDPLADSHHE